MKGIKRMGIFPSMLFPHSSAVSAPPRETLLIS